MQAEVQEDSRPASPLFPDRIYPHRTDCWNCGKPGERLYQSIGMYKCECGCGWYNRINADERVDREHFENRERLKAREAKMPLVDFTRPGALSSPA